VLATFRQAPLDDEPWTQEEEGAVQIVRRRSHVFSQGRTRREARENVIDALRLMLSPDPDEQSQPDREPLELQIAS
jgi:predicted RNase H-like HicB family nuclease